MADFETNATAATTNLTSLLEEIEQVKTSLESDKNATIRCYRTV